MRPVIVLISLLLLAAAPAHAAVGFQHFTIPDPQGAPLEVGVWYPTAAEPRVEPIETDRQTVARDAPVADGRLPLVVMSHGHGGSYAGHADTARALANAGFVVAALSHNGDSWRDPGRPTEIWERPRQLKVLADYMVGTWRDRDHVDDGRIGAFGFSAGGFTVLAIAGGVPDLGTMGEHCRAHPDFEDCAIVARNPLPAGQAITWTQDARIKAVVSAAPALGFAFGRKGLEAVRQPVQLWRAEDDSVLPHPYYAEAVREALPSLPEMHVVARAGHYDFLAPCSERLAKMAPVICTSTPGFDRAAFHAEFNAAVVAFFERKLR